jgi:protein SCO1/2
MNRNIRPIYLLIPLIALLVVVLILFAGFGMLGNANTAQQSSASSTQSNSGLQGTDLGEVAAPDFHLVDQSGKPVSLSQFKGMPVIITFFYTHCPNFCPLLATKIHASLADMGSSAQHVAFLAISVDPKNDTQASVQTFSQEHELQGFANYHYLLGSRSALTPIWNAYHVEGLPPGATVENPNTMIHSSVVYLIDKQGRERILLDYNFTSAELTSDLNTLLR